MQHTASSQLQAARRIDEYRCAAGPRSAVVRVLTGILGIWLIVIDIQGFRANDDNAWARHT